MRILFVDFNITYINPTRNLLPPLLASLGEIDYFGPGYVDNETLVNGLKKYANKNGAYDFIIATEFIVWNYILKYSLKPSLQKSHVINFNIEATPLTKDVFQDFIELNATKIITLLETDFYNLSCEFIKALEESSAYILGWGEEFIGDFKAKKELNEALPIDRET